MRLHAIQCQIIMRSYLSTRILPPFLTCLLLFGLLISGGCIENSGPGPKDGQSAVDCDFSTITGTPIYAHASWGILVVDPQTDEVLYERNADEMFVPASTTKLFTSAAVLESLGPDYRFITPVYAIGTVDRTGILEGHEPFSKALGYLWFAGSDCRSFCEFNQLCGKQKSFRRSGNRISACQA